MPSTSAALDEPHISIKPSADGQLPMGPPRRLRHRRPLLTAVVCLVVVGALVATAAIAGWFPFAKDDSAADAATAAGTSQLVTVSEGSIAETVSAESTVAAAETESLSFSSSGTVSEVLVKAGDVVTVGQVLARVDSASLRADVADAQASVAELQAQIDNYSIELWEYRDDHDDEDDEYDDGDVIEDQITSAQARLDVANDTLADAQEALGGADLTASIAGTVASVDLTVGEQLGSDGTGGTTMTGSGTNSGNSNGSIGSGSTGLPGATTSADGESTAQIEIVSTGRYQVELSLDSTDIANVAVGQQVSITEATSSSSGLPGGGAFPGGGGFPGGGRGGFPGAGQTDQDEEGEDTGPEAVAGGASATGTVTEVSSIADASSGVPSYSVIVQFTDDAGDFYIGTSVIAEITTSNRDGVLLVPSLAVTSANGASTVQVAVDGTLDGRLETRPVTTGETSGNQIEITSGLSVGEQVVVELPGATGGGAFPGGGELPEGFPQRGFPGGGQRPTQDQTGSGADSGSSTDGANG